LYTLIWSKIWSSIEAIPFLLIFLLVTDGRITYFCCFLRSSCTVGLNHWGNRILILLIAFILKYRKLVYWIWALYLCSFNLRCFLWILECLELRTQILKRVRTWKKTSTLWYDFGNTWIKLIRNILLNFLIWLIRISLNLLYTAFIYLVQLRKINILILQLNNILLWIVYIVVSLNIFL
jgi:hypothetical protein